MSDLLKQLPGTPEGQRAIKNNVNEIVDAMLRMEADKELIKEIKEVAKENHNVDGSWLADQAKIKFDREYNANRNNLKALDKAEQVELNAETFK